MPEVIITVSGGVVDIQEKPAGVKVIVRDYDIQGFEEDHLTEDPEGELCRESVFE